MSAPLLAVRDLTRHYPVRDGFSLRGTVRSIRAVDGVSFTVEQGSLFALLGPNGAGKTTLLRTIAGDLPPLDGRLTIGSGVGIGYLAQLRGAAIPGATVLDALPKAQQEREKSSVVIKPVIIK